MSRTWQVTNGVFLTMFVLSVIVQFNDPDPLLWSALYGLAAAACVVAFRRPRNGWFPGAVAAVAVAWAATIAPRVIGRVPFMDMFGAFEMKSTGIEESREMYGLLLVAAWMLVLTARALRVRASTEPADAAAHAASPVRAAVEADRA